ncbi:MAG: RidA family protein [Phycisphaerales bacterium]|nr:RidA family protein [Phycisphaerales bacterium]
MAPTDPAAQLESMGITLPEAPKPVASYIPTRRSGNQVFVSGQIPIAAGELLAKGVVPTKSSLETATACARQCTLNALACLKAEIGDLRRVTRVVKVGVFVASEPGFGDQPKIANGCSDLLVEVFGSEVGQHARAAVGVSALPLDVPVEIEFIFEVQ